MKDDGNTRLSDMVSTVTQSTLKVYMVEGMPYGIQQRQQMR